MISDTTTSARYIVTNGVLAYSIPFRIYTEADVAVFWSADARADTKLTLGTQYTVTILSEGGTVNLLPSVVPVGATLAVVSNIHATQEADFSSTSTVNTKALERQLDRQVQMIQQLDDSVSRSVILPATSSETPQDVMEDIYTARDEAESAASAAAASETAAAASATKSAACAAGASSEADRAQMEADRAQNLANIGPAAADKLGFVKIGVGIAVTDDGTISVTPINFATSENAGTVKPGKGVAVTNDGTLNVSYWDAFPPFIPVPIWGAAFGGSDGRRAIMPGETTAREDWIICDGGTNGKGGTVPALSGRVIIGAKYQELPVGTSGGAKTHNHTVSGYTESSVLTVQQLARHAHWHNTTKNWDGKISVNNGGGSSDLYANNGIVGAATEYTGESWGHNHSVAISSGVASSLPPYLALDFVIRII